MTEYKFNAGEQNFEANLLSKKSGNNYKDHYSPEIRLINVQKNSKASADSSCGFNLTRSKWDPYPWVSAVDKNTPAYDAGLKVGDCILEVNGEDILGLRISEIAEKVRITSDNLLLLLWSIGKDPSCDKRSLCCGPMPLSLERLSASMQTILACLECPVCMDIVPAPVSQCQNGHILCIKCRSKSEKCPICRQNYSCVRSLIAEQIYSSIVDAFKLHVDVDSDGDDDDGDDNDDIHMNNIISSGRKLREKLFGAKYKKKQSDNQQSIALQRKNFTSTATAKSLVANALATKIKSASTIEINDTTSYNSNLNNGGILLHGANHNQQQHHGSGSLFSNYGNGILTPTNKFLAKIMGKAHSLQNLDSKGNCNYTTALEYNNVEAKQAEEKQADFAYLQPSSSNINDSKQLSQSINDLPSLSQQNSKYLGFSAESLPHIAIPRCPSLNPLPFPVAIPRTSLDIEMQNHSTSLRELSSSNSYKDNYINYKMAPNNPTCCDTVIMNTTSKTNSSSSTSTGIMLQKRPSPSPSTSAILCDAKQSKSGKSFGLPANSVENVYSTSTNDVNQCLTLTVPKLNEIKRHHGLGADVAKDDKYDDCKEIKTIKLLDDAERFLCPYDCCENKFNVKNLEHHIKHHHRTPILSFGSSTVEIALPMKEPLCSSIIELNLKKKIFWIKIETDSNESIIVTALLQGTEDESSAFMLEGQLRNRVDDKLLEKQLITRSMVFSMIKSSWRIEQRIGNKCDSIGKLSSVPEINARTTSELTDATARVANTNKIREENVIEAKRVLNDGISAKILQAVIVESKNVLENTVPTTEISSNEKNPYNVEQKSIDDDDDDDNDELYTLNSINNDFCDANSLSAENCSNIFININNDNGISCSCKDDEDNNKDDNSDYISENYKCYNNNSSIHIDCGADNDDILDRHNQFDNMIFQSGSIASTFNNNLKSNNSNREIELLLKICVKYR